MSTFNREELEIKLISRPNAKPNNVKFKFAYHQEFSGFKIGVNAKRTALKKYSETKGVSLINYSKLIGVNYQTLLKYINKQDLGIDNATNVYKTLKGVNFKKLTADAIKYNKFLSTQPKKENDFTGSEKGKIRNLFIANIEVNDLKSGKFFSLPSSETFFETQLNNEVENSFHYLACECEPTKYAEMQQSIINNKLLMSTHFGYSDELTSLLPTNSLSHAFVDYCRTFTSHENEVKQMLLNKTIKIGGLIGFTFCQRDKESKAYHRELLKELGSNDKPTVKGCIKHKLSAYLGGNYEFVEFTGYKDGSPMLFVLLKRIR